MIIPGALLLSLLKKTSVFAGTRYYGELSYRSGYDAMLTIRQSLTKMVHLIILSLPLFLWDHTLSSIIIATKQIMKELETKTLAMVTNVYMKATSQRAGELLT